MNRLPVASDMMPSVGYDSASAVLASEFRNGSIDQYLDVPRDRYDTLLAATSKGRFFNTLVRGAFGFRRVR